MHLKLLRVLQYPEIFKLSWPQATFCHTYGTSVQSTEHLRTSLLLQKTGTLDFGRRWRRVGLGGIFKSTCIPGTRWEAQRTLHRNAKSRTWPGRAGLRIPVRPYGTGPILMFIFILFSIQLPLMSLSTSVTLLQLLYTFLQSFLHSLLFHLPGTLFLTLPHLVQCHLPEKHSLFSHSTVVSSLATHCFLPHNSPMPLHGISHSFCSPPDACLFHAASTALQAPPRQERQCQAVGVNPVKLPTASHRTVCHITGL